MYRSWNCCTSMVTIYSPMSVLEKDVHVLFTSLADIITGECCTCTDRLFAESVRARSACSVHDHVTDAQKLNSGWDGG